MDQIHCEDSETVSLEAATRVRNTLVRRLEQDFDHLSVEYPDDLDTDVTRDSFRLKLVIDVTRDKGLLHSRDEVVGAIEEYEFLYNGQDFKVDLVFDDLMPDHEICGRVTVRMKD